MNERLSPSVGGARDPRRTRAPSALGLVSLTILVLASCSSSSGSSPDGAAGQGGVVGGGGAFGGGGVGGTAGVGSGAGGSGSAQTDASVPGGGGGTGGGMSNACPDPKFPVPCPALNAVPALCWSAGTACSTITKCGNDFVSCTSANAHYECAEMHCVLSVPDGGTECGDPTFPVSCPATADVPKLCWSPGTVCSTVGKCGNDFNSCLSAGYHFSCTDHKCVPDTATDGGVTSPDAGASDSASAADVPPADSSSPADSK